MDSRSSSSASKNKELNLNDTLDELINDSLRITIKNKRIFTTKDLDKLGAKENPKAFLDIISKINFIEYTPIKPTENFETAREIYAMCNENEDKFLFSEMKFLIDSGNYSKVSDKEIVDAIYAPFEGN